MNAIPYRLWPAFGLAALWIVALTCYRVGALGDFCIICSLLAYALTWLIVPFTILAGFISHPIPESGMSSKRLTKRALIARLMAALVLTLLTVTQRPRSSVSYIFSSVASEVRNSFPEVALEFLDADTKAIIPRGEIELRDLPEEVANQMTLLFIDHDRGIDAWGNPYMFVAEDRETGLWIDVYSKGQDGISNSMGNDPDDQNSWGQDGRDYYYPRHKRMILLVLALEGAITFAFYLPICLLTFRKPNPTEMTESGPGE